MEQRLCSVENLVTMFGNTFKGKKVLITGNTGFKGSWLTVWLLKMGAEVYGYSNGILTEPSMYKSLRLEQKIHQHWGDIRQREEFAEYINQVKPDFLFHLAAQAIVSTSYKEPFDTITTNVVGTAAVLDAIKDYQETLTAVIITSDKAYDNVEWLWGYRENDRLGGKDVYSGSKGAAELVIKSYWHSFLEHKPQLRIAVARAGNVIGGGDWSKDRIVVDTVCSFAERKPVLIRSPKATRPWQHVLEPLSGYLRLAQVLQESRTTDININGEAFNFGPRAEQTKTVRQLVEDIAQYWDIDPQDAVRVTDEVTFNEATLLKLNCDKALALLSWKATLNYQQTVQFTAEWYRAWYEGSTDIFSLTNEQISDYERCHSNPA